MRIHSSHIGVIICFFFSRESSPVRDGPGVGLSATLPQRVTPLTAEAVKKLQVRHIIIFYISSYSRAWPGGITSSHPFILQSLKDGVGNHDDDDAESVTSECSTFSISSEVSVSPYVRYPHPITVSTPLINRKYSKLLLISNSKCWW